MGSVLDSGSGGPDSSPAQSHCIVFLGKTLNFIVPLYTLVYKKILANLLLRVTLHWTSIPTKGGGGGGGE